MDYKIVLLLFATILISLPALAVNVVATPTITPSVTNDLAYMAFPIDINAVVTGPDLNSDVSCWYRITNLDTNYAATWLNDRNTCTVNNYTSAGTDDYNFSMVVQNGAKDANAISSRAYYWVDSNAPTETLVTSLLVVTLACTDYATNTGLGSGTSDINYSIDGGAETLVGGTSKVFTLTPGYHDINFACIDNLGNQDSYSNNRVYLQGLAGTGTTTGCGLIVWIIPIFGMLLALFVLLQLMAGKFSPALVSMCIACIIGLVIIWGIGSGICVI